MSVDKYAYFGAYLKVGEIKIQYQAPTIGCPSCKTDNTRSKFCPNCGTAIQDYSKDSTARQVGDLLALAEDQGHLECSDDLFAKYTIDGEIVNTWSEDGIGFECEVNYEFKELKMPDVNQEKAVDFYKEITQILDLYKIPHEIKIGIIFSCR